MLDMSVEVSENLINKNYIFTKMVLIFFYREKKMRMLLNPNAGEQLVIIILVELYE